MGGGGAPARIDSFSGAHRFLSNFVRCPGVVAHWYGPEGGALQAPTVEHAYQAMKAVSPVDYAYILMQCHTPGDAKRYGRRVKLRPNWEELKLPIMRGLVLQKFSLEPLRKMLLATGDAELVEGNTWGDTYWGVCNGRGENMLGKILMDVREVLRGKS